MCRIDLKFVHPYVLETVRGSPISESELKLPITSLNCKLPQEKNHISVPCLRQVLDFFSNWHQNSSNCPLCSLSDLQMMSLLLMEVLGDAHGVPGIIMAAVFAGALR